MNYIVPLIVTIYKYIFYEIHKFFIKQRKDLRRTLYIFFSADFTQLCDLTKPNLNACVVNSANNLIPVLVKGRQIEVQSKCQLSTEDVTPLFLLQVSKISIFLHLIL